MMKYFSEFTRTKSLDFNIINKERIAHEIGRDLAILRINMLGYGLIPGWNFFLNKYHIKLKEVNMLGVRGALCG